MTTLPVNRQLLIGLALALLMAATRYHHFGSALHLPDASLAVFFLAGVYLAPVAVFPVLLLEAGLIDYLAITAGGVSDWCVTPTYWFLIPTYAAMCYGGRWYARHHRNHWSSLLLLTGVVLASATVAFLLSNGSFYWLSGRYPEPHWAEYLERFALYYPRYVLTALGYVAVAAAIHSAIRVLTMKRSDATREAA